METRGAAKRKEKENKDQSFMHRMGLGKLFGQNEVEASSTASSSKSSVKSSLSSKKLAAEAKFEDLLEQKLQELTQLELEEIDAEAFLAEFEDRLAQITEELQNLDANEEAAKALKTEVNELNKSIRQCKANYKKIQVHITMVKKQIERLPQQQKLTQAIIEEEENDQQLSDSEESFGTPDEAVKHWVGTVDPKKVPSSSTSESNAELADLTKRLKDLREFPSEKDKDSNNDSREAEPVEEKAAAAVTPNALDLIAQTLQVMQMSMNKPTTNATDKFIARQTTGKDLPYLGGNPEDWPIFIADFERTTQICQFTSSENLQRLRKCLKGEAAKVVQSMMVSPENVDEIVDTLRTRFGQSKHIIEAMIDKARGFPMVKEDKLESIIEFGTAVRNLTSTIKSLKSDAHLTNPSLLKELEGKLSPVYKMQWIDWVESSASREQNLENFTSWISGRVKVACAISPPSQQVKEDKRDKEDRRDKGKGQDKSKKNFLWPQNKQVAVHATEGQDPHDHKKQCNVCGKDNHFTNQCRVLRGLQPNERMQMVVDKKLCLSCLNPGCQSTTCPRRVPCDIQGCKFFHCKLLHGTTIPLRDMFRANQPRRERPNQNQEQQADQGQQAQGEARVHAIISETLMYVPVEISGPEGKEVIIALLDNGSNTTLINEEVTEEVGAQGPTIPLRMSTPSGQSSYAKSKSVSLTVRAKYHRQRLEVINNVRTLEDVKLAPVTLDAEELKKQYPHLRHIPLISFKNTKPKMLIGSSHYHLINPLKTVEGKPGDPVAVKTRLGWTVVVPDRKGVGIFSSMDSRERAQVSSHHVTVHHTNCDPLQDNELHQLVKKSFTTEDFGVKPTTTKLRSKEDQRALEIMEKTTKRHGDEGRFQTGLLWKQDNIHLPESKKNAYNRLMSQERKMDKDPKFAKAYSAKIKEYEEKGFIRKLEAEEIGANHQRTWYLQHFGVLNPNKPGKLRLVYDAAAKSHGVSLNDNLCQGPDLNNSIVPVLLRFRQYEVAYAGDVKDMFHRVFIQEEDRHSQRFLWRDMKRDTEPNVYEMQVMIFGASSSPTCAQYVKNKAADICSNQYPEAAQVIKKNFYVDDCLHSSPTEMEATKTVKEVIQVMASAGFDICNWISNSTNVLKELPEEKLSKDLMGLNFEEDEIPDGRILGLWWNPENDKMMFRANFHRVPPDVVSGEKRPTKRQILTLVMSVFDPLGFLAHLVVKAKILLQDVWRSGIGWDDEITDTMNEKWQGWLQELQGITGVKIPRCYSPLIPTADSIQLHIFTDASEKAFCAIAFLRAKRNDQVDVNIVMAKTRVAPLKPLSIPRLELQGAVMGTRVAEAICEELDIKINSIKYWTDSTTVMRWIQSDARKYTQFVSHRIGEILEASKVEEWNWIPTKLNVADDATRDNKPSDLSETSRWFNGPDFLKLDEEFWPKEKPRLNKDDSQDELELKTQVHAVEILEPMMDVKRFSKYSVLLGATAIILRFARNWKAPKTGRKMVPSVEDLRKAELYWCKQVQRESFAEELRLLDGGKSLGKDSRLRHLDPFVDADGLIKIRGRLGNANVAFRAKHPIILDNKHRFVGLLIDHYHRMCGHQGVQTVANELRQKFWILNRISAVKKVFHECQECKNRKATAVAPRMADLPAARLDSHIRPFSNCGLDYFGPMQVVIGRRHEKRWGALFTCMSIRAVHVELVNSLTSDSAINAIRRMGNRRGHPSHLYCDNGTNFKGAETELKNALRELDHDKVAEELKKNSIQFHYNPPAAPHMGGVWERMVQTIKKVLNRILRVTVPTEEILSTFLSEAENVVNSRPLTHVSVDPQDPRSLTPNDLLIGWSNGSAQNKEINQPVLGVFDNSDLLKKGWKFAQRLADQFWQQWVRDYLPTLTRRSKWEEERSPIKIDDIVIVVDDQATRNSWEMGRIVAVYPGKDGQVRMVDVKTKSGVYRRPATKIAVLDVMKDEPTSSTAVIGGKNVGERHKRN